MRTMAEPRPAAGWRGRLEHLATFAVIAALIGWAWHGTEFDLAKLGDSLPRLAEFFGRMVPPDLTVTETVALSTIETLQIALLGTALSAVASLVLGLLAAANLTPPWVHQPVKWLLGVLRGIPMLLLALIFVSAVGLGPLPGVLTIAVHATGMLGKFKGGSIMLAMEAGLPLVPISVVGSRHVMKKGELTTKPGHVTLIVHAPIELAATPEPSVQAVRELADRVRDIIRPPVEAEARAGAA